VDPVDEVVRPGRLDGVVVRAAVQGGEDVGGAPAPAQHHDQGGPGRIVPPHGAENLETVGGGYADAAQDEGRPMPPASRRAASLPLAVSVL
jgi:hypothetical protein